MKELFRKSFDLVRGDPILWAPSVIAALITVSLDRLEKTGVHWFIRHFAYQHSVLGGSVPVSPSEWQHLAMMTIIPLGFLKHFLTVTTFVFTFVVTALMVRSTLDAKRPEIRAILRETGDDWRKILVFSVLCMVCLGASVGISRYLLILLSENLHPEAVVGPHILTYTFGLVVEFAAAWLLMPRAMRLLQQSSSFSIDSGGRTTGALIVILTGAIGLLIARALGGTESAIALQGQIAQIILLVLNAIVESLPQAFMFVALALIAYPAVAEAGTSENPESAPQLSE